jgi:hypothetical protein
MPSDHDEVPAGAVIAAMELVKGLGSDENAMPRRRAAQPHPRCKRQPRGTDARVRAADRLVHAHAGRPPGLGAAPHPQAPGTGVGTGRGAADDGWSVDGWSVGPVTVGLALCRRLRRLDSRSLGGTRLGLHRMALADFLDFAADEQGATAKLTDSLFARLLEDDADDERGS